MCNLQYVLIPSHTEILTFYQIKFYAMLPTMQVVIHTGLRWELWPIWEMLELLGLLDWKNLVKRRHHWQRHLIWPLLATWVHRYIALEKSEIFFYCMTKLLYWNSWLLFQRCADAVVSDKEKYPTFARTLPPSSKISSALLCTIVNFKWKQVSTNVTSFLSG